MPSATIEEYLETIYKLSERGEVRPTQIAESLGVSGPTVTATLRRLAEHGYVERPDGGVSLTTEGARSAIDIIRRHRLAERFLVDTLGLPWEDVHEDACRLEHAFSPRVQDALERFLENPEFCPHGHPIPSADGSIARPEGDPLSRFEPGSEVEVVRIEEEDEDLLGYLASLALFPGTKVEIKDRAPFQGPLMIQIRKSKYALGRDIASKIIVRQLAPAVQHRARG